MKIGMAGRFKIIAQKVKLDEQGKPLLDENGKQILCGEPWQAAKFDNLIHDIGLNKLGDGNPFAYIYASSDGAEPEVGDTTVQQVIGSATLGVSQDGNENKTQAPYWTEGFKKAQFAAGIATGNIAKLAVGWGGTTPSGIWSSSLVKDANEQPIIIEKKADEIWTVYYILRRYIPDQDFTGVCQINNEDYNYTIRAANLNNWSSAFSITINGCFAQNGNLVDIFNIPECFGGTKSYLSKSTVPYVNKSYKKGFEFNAGYSSANYNDSNHPTGIRSFLFYDSGNLYFQAEFSRVSDGASIAKDDTQEMTLKTFYIGWGRY